ncbi:acetate kinase [Actinoplanes sp. NPDC024001]|uniref:acetate/propionate family kinase n=1 Tax=unclassified Actinoplanes TaxID=2626549 RepID=UPI002E1A1FB2
MDRVLVLNCGSSSVRYKLFNGDTATAKGLTERIGEPGGGPADHRQALQQLMDSVDLNGLTAIGHRVVHGGVTFTAPTVVSDDVISAISELIPLAPLHNPAAVTGIRVCRELLPSVPQVAVFDTAFHSTIPTEAAMWALDTEIAERWGIRRYGFHGTSHAYVSRATARLLGKPVEDTDLIILHLGNGASITAVHAGRSVATSMGLTPLSGLVMGTRTGDIDPSVIFHLHRVAGLTLDQIEELLTRRSGLLGLTGDNDMRLIEQRRDADDPAARRAFDIYCRRVKEYVGAYLAVLGRADAITFTAGIGEHSALVRSQSLSGLEAFGIFLDSNRNEADAPVISVDGSPIAVCVVPTEEELEIANETRRALAARPH